MRIKKEPRDYFPMIRTKQEILREIRPKKNLNGLFDSWKGEQQKEFWDFTSGMKGVKIKCILPGDNSRIAGESSLLIMDILVELEDGSLANIECQKIGYKFPSQSAACYSADLLLRQYKRVRGEKGEAFCYKDVKKVYTIVLFEKSTDNFHEFPDDYIHYAKPTVDTGLEMELLQEYVFIPLDIFREKLSPT
jgi:hypothetical protein